MKENAIAMPAFKNEAYNIIIAKEAGLHVIVSNSKSFFALGHGKNALPTATLKGLFF